MPNSYSTSSKTTPSSPSLPSSQYIVGCNKSIGPKPHLRTSDPQTRVRTPLMPTRKVLSEWIRRSLHPYLLSLTSCSSRWSHTPCNFSLPCLYPYYFFCLEYPSLPSCLCLPGLPNKLVYPLKPCHAPFICTISTPYMCFYHHMGWVHCICTFAYTPLPKPLSSLIARAMCHSS